MQYLQYKLTGLDTNAVHADREMQTLICKQTETAITRHWSYWAAVVDLAF